jgi:hypothetical protein
MADVADNKTVDASLGKRCQRWGLKRMDANAVEMRRQIGRFGT